LKETPGGYGDLVGLDAPALGRGHDRGDVFVHEAFLYAGDDQFVDGITRFATNAVEAGEPILVMVGKRKLDIVRDALDDHRAHVQFADMEHVGANPARIIPAWADFVAGHAGSAARLRGVGEPIWRGRSADELVESQHHESFLNLAFADARGMWLVCPYDTEALDPSVIDEAHRSHPVVSAKQVGAAHESNRYRPAAEIMSTAFEAPLPEPPGAPPPFAFSASELRFVRAVVAGYARAAGLREAKTSDLVIAASEVATNSIRYGGGRGTVRMWSDGGTVVCEVRDAGRIDRALVGRERPTRDRDGGAGLFLANSFCDLVQLRSGPAGTVVRLHMRVY
jgi:anti-sigma regulatory factor (Ser/Thr protein kinase)